MANHFEISMANHFEISMAKLTMADAPPRGSRTLAS
jgi:hypothetical protein